MRVDVDDGQRSVPLGHGPEDRIRDAVVAANRDGLAPGRVDVTELLVDPLKRPLDLERRRADVAVVRHPDLPVQGDVVDRMVDPDGARAIPDRAGRQPGPDAIARAGVERHPDEREVERAGVADMGQTQERADARVPGIHHAVDGFRPVARSLTVVTLATCHVPSRARGSGHGEVSSGPVPQRRTTLPEIVHAGNGDRVRL